MKNTFTEISDYTTYFKEFKKNKEELSELKSKNIIECSKVTKSAEEKLQKLGVELKISKAI